MIKPFKVNISDQVLEAIYDKVKNTHGMKSLMMVTGSMEPT